MFGPIRIHGNPGRRRYGVRRLEPERDGMRRLRVQVGPLYGVPNMDERRPRQKAHDRHDLSSASSRQDLSDPGAHGILRSSLCRGRSTALEARAVRKQLGSLFVSLAVIEGLIMGKSF